MLHLRTLEESCLCFLQYVAKKLCMQLLLVQNQYLEGIQAKSKSGTIIKAEEVLMVKSLQIYFHFYSQSQRKSLSLIA